MNLLCLFSKWLKQSLCCFLFCIRLLVHRTIGGWKLVIWSEICIFHNLIVSFLQLYLFIYISFHLFSFGWTRDTMSMAITMSLKIQLKRLVFLKGTTNVPNVSATIWWEAISVEQKVLCNEKPNSQLIFKFSSMSLLQVLSVLLMTNL